ncbi:MAG TPA: protease inhibitor I42 family protein [Lachnospiraceae bacterium]
MRNRKRILALLFVFLVVIILCLIGDGLIGTKTYEDDGQKKEVKTYVLELKGNITRGYEWECRIDNEDILKLKSKEYEEGSKGEEKGSKGAEGTFIFEFEGLKEGDTKVELFYVRAWEAKTEPLKRMTYHLHVDEDGNVTQVLEK